MFRLEDGSIVRGPATAPEPAFDVRVNEGQIEVRPRS
jgi:nitrite reductase/ring-hydroxylating ferredoxin subunit